MTEHATSPQADKANERPAFRAFIVQDREGAEPIWTELVGLWPTKSGKGFTGTLRKPIAFTGGRIVVLPANANPGKEG